MESVNPWHLILGVRVLTRDWYEGNRKDPVVAVRYNGRYIVIRGVGSVLYARMRGEPRIKVEAVSLNDIRLEKVVTWVDSIPPYVKHYKGEDYKIYNRKGDMIARIDESTFVRILLDTECGKNYKIVPREYSLEEIVRRAVEGNPIPPNTVRFVVRRVEGV